MANKKQPIVKEPAAEIEQPDKNIPMKQYTIVLKEKNKKGDLLCKDVDTMVPLFMFGESTPMVMGVIDDDKSIIVPLSNVNWMEQNYGFKDDVKIAKTIVAEKMRQKGIKTNDPSFN